MVSLIGLVGMSSLFFIVIIGLGYWLYIKTRPKKIAWNADVYIEGGGTLKKVRDEKDNIIPDQTKLYGLRPYTKDILERVEKDKGKVIYRLIKLNKTTPEVSGDCVDYWGQNEKRVAVLMKGETCTILRKGMDNLGNMIFRPLPYEKVNMITNQMAIRKDRLHKEKDILAQILPYVAVVGAIIGLVAIGWVMGKSYVDMSENFKEAQEHNDKALIEAAQIMADAMGKFGTIQQVVSPTGVQNPNPPITTT